MEGRVHQGLYEERQRLGRRRTVAGYFQMLPVAGLPVRRSSVPILGHLLDEIGRHEHQQGRPLLAALVVRKREGTPGPGFYDLARELGLLQGDGDAEALLFFEQERQRIYDAWR